jgi:ElaA protein
VDLTWHVREFADLAAGELYAILALRARVFVVEQNCAYLDPDGADLVSRHVWTADEAGAVLAYLRVVPAGTKFPEISIGRVITAPEARGTGLGKELMRRALAACGAVPVRIGAQAHLEKFYGELGFARASDVYDEDGIPHIEMVRPASPRTRCTRAARPRRSRARRPRGRPRPLRLSLSSSATGR